VRCEDFLSLQRVAECLTAGGRGVDPGVPGAVVTMVAVARRSVEGKLVGSGVGTNAQAPAHPAIDRGERRRLGR